jgi:hypothetical protein
MEYLLRDVFSPAPRNLFVLDVVRDYNSASSPFVRMNGDPFPPIDRDASSHRCFFVGFAYGIRMVGFTGSDIGTNATAEALLHTASKKVKPSAPECDFSRLKVVYYRLPWLVAFPRPQVWMTGFPLAFPKPNKAPVWDTEPAFGWAASFPPFPPVRSRREPIVLDLTLPASVPPSEDEGSISPTYEPTSPSYSFSEHPGPTSPAYSPTSPAHRPGEALGSTALAHEPTSPYNPESEPTSPYNPESEPTSPYNPESEPTSPYNPESEDFDCPMTESASG